MPGPPVEVALALSILLLAYEISRLQNWERRSAKSGTTSLAEQQVELLIARWPRVVAFTFGLQHGFGFAGALTEIGLPQSDLPLALSIGLEA